VRAPSGSVPIFDEADSNLLVVGSTVVRVLLSLRRAARNSIRSAVIELGLCLREKTDRVVTLILGGTEESFVSILSNTNEFHFVGSEFRELLTLSLELAFTIILHTECATLNASRTKENRLMK
jgi:hypothetical protein